MAATKEPTTANEQHQELAATPACHDVAHGEQPPSLTCREAALRHENLQLERLLRQAQAIIELQKRIRQS